MRGFMISLTRNGKAKGRKRAFQVLVNNYLNDIHGSEHMCYQNTTVYTVVITWVAKMKTVQQYSFYKVYTRYHFSDLKSATEMLAATETGIVKSDSKNDAIGLCWS